MENKLGRNGIFAFESINRDSGKPRPWIPFCQEPSQQYLEALVEAGGDPRSVVGFQAIRESGAQAERGWRPTWDARDRRI